MVHETISLTVSSTNSKVACSLIKSSAIRSTSFSSSWCPDSFSLSSYASMVCGRHQKIKKKEERIQQGQKEEKTARKSGLTYSRYALMNSSKLLLCFDNLPHGLLSRVVLNDSQSRSISTLRKILHFQHFFFFKVTSPWLKRYFRSGSQS